MVLDPQKVPYLQAGLVGAFEAALTNIADVHAETTDENLKDKLNSTYTMLQQVANGLAHQARWEKLGSTPDSPTTPAVPIINSEDDVVSLS